MRPTTLDFLYQLARPVLFRLDAEAAHHATLAALRWTEKCGLARLMSPPAHGTPVRLMGLDFPNRVGLAAGMDKSGTCVDALGALGFGHVEVGTITPRPQAGNPSPRLFRLVERDAIINRMGFNNPGLEAALANIAKRKWPGIVGFNIGKNADTPNDRAADDYLAGLRGAAGRADYVAVNISSPNTKGLRDLQEETALRHLLRSLKEEQDRLAQHHGASTPLALKISPDLSPDHTKALAALFLSEKIDAVIATNTTLSRHGVADLDSSRETGGLSGAPVREKSTALITLLKSEVGTALPIIGVGGILCAADAQEKLEAGASLVQLYTGLIYRGPALVAELAAL